MPKFNKEPLATRAVKAKVLELIAAGQSPKVAARNALAWAERQDAHKAAAQRLGRRSGRGNAATNRKAEARRAKHFVDNAQAEADAVEQHMALCYAPFQPGTCSMHGLAVSQVPHGWSVGTGSVPDYRTPDDARKGELLEADQPRSARTVGNPAAQLVPRGEEHGEQLAHLQAAAVKHNRPVLKRKNGS
jgi:hypothetical protein